MLFLYYPCVCVEGGYPLKFFPFYKFTFNRPELNQENSIKIGYYSYTYIHLLQITGTVSMDKNDSKIIQLTRELESCQISSKNCYCELKILFNQIFDKVMANEMKEAEALQIEFLDLIKTIKDRWISLYRNI